MAYTTYSLLVLVSALAWYLYAFLKQWRFNKFRHIPHVFPKGLWTGHISAVASGYKKFGDTRRHFDYIAEDMLESVGRPEIMFLDMRPVMYGMLIVASHDVAEQVSRATKVRPYSVAKSPTLGWLHRLIGRKSILTRENEEWKALRKTFNPGFAPQHIQSLLPQILEKTAIFTAKLDALAKSESEFEMEGLCTSLTFDIIGKVVMNLDFHAQDSSGGVDIVRYYQTLNATFSDTGRIPLWLNVPALITRAISSYRSDKALKRAIKAQFDQIKATQTSESKQGKDRSVVALALKDTDTLTADVLQSTADQVKTFLFAGHDTTSILLQWLFYALSIHPKCLAAIRAEHDAVFGDDDPHEVFLARPDETMKALSYTSACIKETLRLWPPAASARMPPPGNGFKVRLENGDEVCIDGCVVYMCHYLIHRDPKVYGETAHDFVPERWLGDSDTSSEDPTGSTDSKVPISAWRAFERGPRNCIGQELANLEPRVILACAMRRYDFVKVGAGEVEVDEKGAPVVDEKGRYKTKSELFNSAVVTSKPFDHCRMRVQMRQPAV